MGIVTFARSQLTSLFLDIYSPLFAHSMARLKAVPVTSAIEVLNVSSGVYADIGFYGVYLDVATLTTHLAGAVGTVRKIYDQTGNGYHWRQNIAGNQPHITDLAGNILYDNGKPTISFNIGSNRFMELPTGLLNGATNLSYFHVMNITEPGGSNAAAFGPTAANSVGLEILQHNVISIRAMLRINGTSRNNNAAAAYQLWNDAAQCMTTVIGNPTSVAAWNNSTGVTLTSSAAMPALNFNGVYALGRYATSYYMTGRWQEDIVFDTDQTANRAAIQTDRNNYYNIAGF